MYEIRNPADGTVMGTVEFDPFQFDLTEAGRDAGLEPRLDGIEEATVVSAAAPPDGDGTAAERLEVPGTFVIKSRVAQFIKAEGLLAERVQ